MNKKRPDDLRVKRMKVLQLKPSLKAIQHDPFKTLRNKKIVTQAFFDCLEDDDPKAALDILIAYYKAGLQM